MRHRNLAAEFCFTAAGLAACAWILIVLGSRFPGFANLRILLWQAYGIGAVLFALVALSLQPRDARPKAPPLADLQIADPGPPVCFLCPAVMPQVPGAPEGVSDGEGWLSLDYFHPSRKQGEPFCAFMVCPACLPRIVSTNGTQVLKHSMDTILARPLPQATYWTFR